MENQLIQKLKETIKGEVTVSEADLEKYSHDASIFEVKPEAVVFPKNTKDIENIVKFVSANKAQNPNLSITGRSGGTCMSGGSINDSLILDFTAHMNHFIEMGSNYAVAEPGMYYRDFETETLKHGLLFPSYTASKSICALGGMLANNSGGEKSLSYGKTENHVQELWAVLADGQEYSFKPLTEAELEDKMRRPTFEGQVYRQMFDLINKNYDAIIKAKPHVSKNSAGYYLWNVWDKKKFDLIKLLVGSQGTLGIFTKAKFDLIRPKPKSELLVMFLNDLAQLGEIVNTVMQYKPESFESFDDHTLKLAIKFLPGIIKAMKGNVFKLGLQFLPELWMTLTGGIPKLILIAEFTGETEEEVKANLKKAQEEIRQKFHLHTHMTVSVDEAQKYWTVRRESFNLLRKHVQGKHTAPFIDDIAVRPEQLPEFLPRLNALFARYPSLIYTIAGHAGDANFHIIPLMDFSSITERHIIPQLSGEVYDLIAEFHGTITAEHNDGLIRTPYLGKMYDPLILDLFEQTKKIFDPQGIFNPRKKVGGSLQYSLDHIRQKF